MKSEEDQMHDHLRATIMRELVKIAILLFLSLTGCAALLWLIIR